MASNYVSGGEMIEERREAITVQTVWAMWLGNAGSGLGCGIIVAIVVNRLAGFGALDTAIWGVCAAGLAFGTLMAVRFSLDEIVEAWEWRRALADIERLEEENELLRARLTSLQQDLDYTNLQRAVAGRVPPPAVTKVQPVDGASPAVRDAEQLLTNHFGGKPWARDAMRQSADWGRTRWEAAVDVLKGAGIVGMNGRSTVVVPDTLSEAISRLRAVQNQAGNQDS